MTTASDDEQQDSGRLSRALGLVLTRYGAQIRRRPWLSAAALLLPAVGDVLTNYAPPLVVARILGAFVRDEALSPATLVPYVLLFASLWVGSQVVWRLATAAIIRIEVRAIEALYIEAMDELLARSEEHTSELQSLRHLVCRLLLEKKKK